MGKTSRSLSRAIFVYLSVSLATSSCTEPMDSGGRPNKDASQINVDDAARPLDLGASDGHVDDRGLPTGPRRAPARGQHLSRLRSRHDQHRQRGRDVHRHERRQQRERRAQRGARQQRRTR